MTTPGGDDSDIERARRRRQPRSTLRMDVVEHDGKRWLAVAVNDQEVLLGREDAADIVRKLNELLESDDAPD